MSGIYGNDVDGTSAHSWSFELDSYYIVDSHLSYDYVVGCVFHSIHYVHINAVCYDNRDDIFTDYLRRSHEVDYYNALLLIPQFDIEI